MELNAPLAASHRTYVTVHGNRLYDTKKKYCPKYEFAFYLTIPAMQSFFAVYMPMLLLTIYAAGLGIPFILVAIFFPSLKGIMRWMKRHMQRIERTMGLLLWTVGLMMVTGQFTRVSWWILEQFPALPSLIHI